jgi:hypothetical protein
VVKVAQVLQEPRVSKALKVPQARLAQPEFKVLMERLELLVCRVFKVPRELQALLEFKVFKGRLA